MKPAVVPASMAPRTDPAVRGLVPGALTKGGVDLRLWTMEIVHNGALIRSAHLPPTLLGELRWIAPSSIGWYPAFGDRLDDARHFTYDAYQIGRGSITFFDGNIEVAELTTIDRAGLPDPDDYRVAWQLWLEIVPLRRAFIDACIDAHVATLEAARTARQQSEPAFTPALSPGGVGSALPASPAAMPAPESVVQAA